MCSSSDLFLTLSWAEDSILQYCIRLLLYSCVPPKVLMSLVWLEASLCVRTEEPPGKVLETLSYVKKMGLDHFKRAESMNFRINCKGLVKSKFNIQKVKSNKLGSSGKVLRSWFNFQNGTTDLEMKFKNV